jgi:hypothetical protein
VVLPLGIIENRSDDDVHLAWEVILDLSDGEKTLAAYTAYVDAHAGRVLKILDNIQRLYRQVYDCNTYPATCAMDLYRAQYNYWFGRSEPNPMRGPHPIPGIFYGSNDVDILFTLLGESHQYWVAIFNRNGANGQGGLGTGRPGEVPVDKTRGLVHIDDQCPGCMGFSHTGKVQFGIGWMAPDVVGHEYAHGVTYWNFRDVNNYPIGSIYAGQTGSLNENYSSLCGEALEEVIVGSCDWHANTGTTHLTLNMADPPSYIDRYTGFSYPDRTFYSTYYCGDGDNGGNHINSGVPCKGAYLMSMGGEFNGCNIQPIGFDAVQRVFYRAWTTYLTRTVTFNEAVTGLQQACMDLYPDSRASVTAALQAVEMDQAGRCDTAAVEQAPACAVHSAGIVSCDSVGYVGGDILVNGIGGYAGRVATLYLRPHQDSTAIWSAITDTIHTTAIIESNGTFSAVLLPADTGRFDIVADENSDGFYQPWADTVLTVHVLNGTVQNLVAQFVQPASIRLTWRSFSGAASYAVEADSTAEFLAPAVLATVADTSYTDSVSVALHGRVFYRVRAVSE